jgi:hypothetical protein
MKNISRTALTVLGGGLLLGVIADLMLKETWGLNFLIFISILVALMFIHRRWESSLSNHSISLMVVLIGLAATFVWRDADQLKVLAFLGILTTFSGLMFTRLGVQGHLAGVTHYVMGFVSSGISSVFGPFVFLNKDFRSDDSMASKRIGVGFSLVKGLVIATPILLIFIGLFSSADPEFKALINWIVTLPGVEVTMEYVLSIGLVSWFCYGYLRSSSAFLNGQSEKKESEDISSPADQDSGKFSQMFRVAIAGIRSKFDIMNFQSSMLPKALTLGVVEITVIFGSLNTLFLIFVFLQVEYLFGGFKFVQEVDGLKLSDYARNGFGELVFVSFLVLPIVLLSHWLVRKDGGRAERTFKELATLLIVLLFVIMASAVQRFSILTSHLGYGFTAPRFYALVFMIWLAFVFIWLVAMIIIGKRSRFAIGMYWSAMLFVFGLNIVNPDDFIVRQNLSLIKEGREFDSAYPASLSNDAVPALIEAYPKMNAAQQCEIFQALNEKSDELSKNDTWLSWNLSRSNSSRALSKENSPLFDPNAACDAPPPATQQNNEPSL